MESLPPLNKFPMGPPPAGLYCLYAAQSIMMFSLIYKRVNAK